jgi:heterogeneous nuclear ribonucleoprotein G
MSDAEEYRVFIGNLSWNTTDRSLEDAFIKFGKIADAKVSHQLGFS